MCMCVVVGGGEEGNVGEVNNKQNLTNLSKLYLFSMLRGVDAALHI